MTDSSIPSEAKGVARYEPISVSDESTVVAEYLFDPSRETKYQSEAELEAAFIDLLQGQAYQYLSISDEDTLMSNLRVQLEMLNVVKFTDGEWRRFFAESISGASDGIVEKTARIQEDHVQVLQRDDGSVKNIRLIDKTNIHNNRLQVINQYEAQGARSNRYDVTVLVNGLPLVHIELKRRGVDIREAFNQINRYQRDSFRADSGLFQYVQLFVISNGTLTKYYSNTTREQHVNEATSGRRSKKQSSNTFEFTSWWADASNRPITELAGFTKTFFAKHTLLNILTKYCVFDVDRKLLVMRPYQIVAAERILQRIEVSSNYKKWGTIAGGGYIWHTTGSGKTLTSFKAAQLASKLPDVDKVLFVVDRKDLDYQTMKEYERFEKGAANSNTSTKVLKKQLENSDARIIITTIQKLSNFIGQNKQHEIYAGHLVIIFDECHRSQFGDMHTAITKAFKKYHLFGFTGTPIFADNAGSSGNPSLRTTEQAFGDQLHNYTIVDAIGDKNVLPFRIDYINTIRESPTVADKQVSAIDTERALLAPERINQVVDYILDHFDQKTKRGVSYRSGEQRLMGFNSLFATASIEAAKHYYAAIEARQRLREAEVPSYRRLKVALIYSFAANEDVDGFLADEQFETYDLDVPSRDFLDDAIRDYNQMFVTSFDTSADRFENYYKDVSNRMKSRELDMVVVVNMFLTGFDATTLNTIWVDKNLRQHSLLQAYSRTNRILNSVKTYGNIVAFRNLEDATNDALTLFGNKDAKGVVILKPYAEYYAAYDERVGELLQNFPLGEPIVSEEQQKVFIVLFGAILRLRNILTAFDEFAGNEILVPRQIQDYQSLYLNLYQEFRRQSEVERESILDDLVFEIELIKQVEVNVDYVLMLVDQYRRERGAGTDREIGILSNIERAIDSSVSLRNKKDLIMAFVESISVSADTNEDWRAFIEQKRAEELDEIIAGEGLNPDATRAFISSAFRDGGVTTSGTSITQVMPAVSRFSPDNIHAEKKQTVVERLTAFFERYIGLV
jgi:type I restriction enzyme R subunit